MPGGLAQGAHLVPLRGSIRSYTTMLRSANNSAARAGRRSWRGLCHFPRVPGYT